MRFIIKRAGVFFIAFKLDLRPLTTVFGTSLFDYLQQNADAAETLNQGMTNLSAMLAYAVLMAYDFTGISSIVDVGGGEGKLLREDSGVESSNERSKFFVARRNHRNSKSKGQQRYVPGAMFILYRRGFLRVGSTGSRCVPSLRGRS